MFVNIYKIFTDFEINHEINQCINRGVGPPDLGGEIKFLHAEACWLAANLS